MQVLSGCGHVVHEDVPDRVSSLILLTISLKFHFLFNGESVACETEWLHR